MLSRDMAKNRDDVRKTKEENKSIQQKLKNLKMVPACSRGGSQRVTGSGGRWERPDRRSAEKDPEICAADAAALQ